VDVTPVAFANLIQHSPIPLVVDCWADWCQPCKAFAPTFSSVAIEKARQALFLKLDTQTHQQLAGQLNIRSIPTLLIFNEGKEIIRQSGALPRDQFLHWLKKSGI
jgi:thioredoxin 2